MVSLCTRNKNYRQHCSGAKCMGSGIRDLASHMSPPILAAKALVSVSPAGKQGRRDPPHGLAPALVSTSYLLSVMLAQTHFIKLVLSS